MLNVNINSVPRSNRMAYHDRNDECYETRVYSTRNLTMILFTVISSIGMRVDLFDYSFDRAAPRLPREIHLYTFSISPSLNSRIVSEIVSETKTADVSARFRMAKAVSAETITSIWGDRSPKPKLSRKEIARYRSLPRGHVSVSLYDCSFRIHPFTANDRDLVLSRILYTN